MFDSSQHSAGREYTVTVALLAVALIFIPALVAVSQPWSYSPASGSECALFDCGMDPLEEVSNGLHSPRLPLNKRPAK